MNVESLVLLQPAFHTSKLGRKSCILWTRLRPALTVKFSSNPPCQIDAALPLSELASANLLSWTRVIYRVFVTGTDNPLDFLVWFYNQRAGAENLIKEANNDAGLAAHPSNRWIMNANWFQIAILRNNLNCWLQLFEREENATVEGMKHTTLATARLRFLIPASKIGIWGTPSCCKNQGSEPESKPLRIPHG
jgi:hypothetical protein